MTVTGRQYKRTRVRGFADWKPQAATRPLLGRCQQIVTDYAAQLPLTVRQMFYILVAADALPKTEKAYQGLGEMLNRARRAGMIDMEAIHDSSGTAPLLPTGFWGANNFWHNVTRWANGYTHRLDDDQPVIAEVWVEAAGMVPQAARVATDDYGVPVYPSGGFDSLDIKYRHAKRIASRSEPTMILSVGDYDASGCAIIDSAAEDVTAFLAGFGARPPEFRRVAVTPEQITTHRLPTQPQKQRMDGKDVAGGPMAMTVQAEALRPDALAGTLRAAIEDVVDVELIEDMRQAGADERLEILENLRTLLEDDET
jgi:hypothetical protein